jgi:hypothetical protein
MSHHIAPSTNQPDQQPVSQNKRERFKLEYDMSVPLFKRAQKAGVGTEGIESFVFRDVRPLEGIVSFGYFFYVVVPENTRDYQLIRETVESEGSCEPANLDETVAFFGICPKPCRFNRIACINVGLDRSGPGIGRCIPHFVFMRTDYDVCLDTCVVKTTVSEPDSRLLKKGDIVVFRVIVEN